MVIPKTRENRSIIRQHYLIYLGKRDGQGWRCFYCGAPLLPYGENRKKRSPVIDHKDPYSMIDDPHTDENMVLACYHCNNRKSNLNAEQFSLLTPSLIAQAQAEELCSLRNIYFSHISAGTWFECEAETRIDLSERKWALLELLMVVRYEQPVIFNSFTRDEKIAILEEECDRADLEYMTWAHDQSIGDPSQ